VGRKDRQLKLRGYRIEAGEVEAALCRYDAVVRAAVVLCKDQNENEQLAAYIVCKDGVAPDMGALKACLKTIIPSYMIPAWIVELDDLPMTVGGKLDRRQLPATDVDFTSAEAYVAPTTETERKLTEIWEAVLSADKIGIHDDFFNLGGHSLMATQAISRIQAEMQVIVPLGVLFAQPNITGLALWIDEHIATSSATGNVGQIERADDEIDPAYLEALSDKEVAKLLSELAGSAESET
jgi:hypothetical protein